MALFFSGLLLGAGLINFLFSRAEKGFEPPAPKQQYRPQIIDSPELASQSSCLNWDFKLIAGGQLPDALEEMSGLAFSRVWKNVLYHVNDSGNDPLLVLTDREGKFLTEIPFAEHNTDTEDLEYGPCPWGGPCLYVSDTGDNFHLRSERMIHILDERTLFSGQLKKITVSIAYPDSTPFDVEALAVHPRTGLLYFFTKEPGKTQVLTAEIKIDSKRVEAQKIATLKRTMVTAASFHPTGDSIILLNWEGALQVADVEKPGFTRGERDWFPYQKKIAIPSLAQQEAIAFDPTGQSFFYSSERKPWSKKPWGLIQARCQRPSP